MEKKINVVVIDDEREILSSIERFLSKSDKYKVKTYENPINALSSLSQDTDVILLDVMMPQINGLDLLPKLQEKLPDVKVIIMTAYSTLETVTNAHRKGATDYIMKPFPSLREVEKKIDSIMKR
jgi:DNA-binding NtrC family response regulator